jgi:hypothetical protein
MKSILLAIAAVAVAPLNAGAVPLCGTAYSYGCCKVCHKGKACGDSCISREKACHKGKGCACNG